MLKAIVFDFDGVIVDSEPLHFAAFLETFQPFGVSFDYAEYLERFVGYDDRDVARIVLAELAGRGDEADNADRLAELCRHKQEAFERIVAEGAKPIPGALELIAEAARTRPLAVASGATRRDIELILSQLGLEGRFAPIVTADDVSRSKPDPETYRLAVEGLAARHPAAGIEPATTLAIEDTSTGLAAARAAGLQTLGVATTESHNSLHLAHRAVESLTEVDMATLEQWFA